MPADEARPRGGGGAADRPDPASPELAADEPLRPEAARFLARARGDAPRARGRLKIYLGAAPGVGKTYEMLHEGRRLKAEGVDVVVGLVETHGRAETEAAIGDLECVPRRIVEYKGRALEEMDTDAIIARRPAVCLVDELAHTNVPGSAREKRWMDVEALRDAGIDAIATLNVQHLESVHLAVESITGVAVRETIPDRIVDDADQVELVDIPPETLRKRLEQGKVYPPARAEAALANFFRIGNLGALRELALRRTAKEVQDQLERYMAEHGIAGVWPATERLVVLVDERPASKNLIRAAWRLGQGLRVDSTIALVVADRAALALPARQCLAEVERLADDLEIEVAGLPPDAAGGARADAIVRFLRERNATHLMLAQAPRSRLDALLRGSLIDHVLRHATGVDLYVVGER
jgi:two-component system, OmpR family, sensor histidine kinase KdpD